MSADVVNFVVLLAGAYVLGYGTRAYISHRYRRRYRFSLSRA
jgi:hypothetical protein